MKELGYEPVFLLAGQSNMAGRCDMADLPPSYVAQHLSSKSNKKEPTFFIKYQNDGNFPSPSTSNSFVPLQCQYSSGLRKNLFGPEFGLAEALASRLPSSTRRVCFLKFAKGSTSLHSNWNPDNHRTVGKPEEIGYFSTFVEYIKSSMQQLNYQHDTESESFAPKIAGLFWLQGESDSSKAKDANAYLRNFESFCAALRSELACPDLPIIVSPVVWKGKKVHVVNQALREASKTIPHCICIDSLHLANDGIESVIQPAEAGPCADHLTAGAILDIGQRMGMAWSTLIMDEND